MEGVAAAALAFVVATAVVFALVRLGRSPGLLPAPPDRAAAPQTLHPGVVPRLGGLGILAGLAVASAALWAVQPQAHAPGLLLLGCALPAFGAGLAEDLGRSLSPWRRLALVALSAALALWALGTAITRTDIPGLDTLVAFTLGSAALTVFAVTGVVNAVNIIDGLNGLAATCVVLMLAAIALVAVLVGDGTVLALAGAGAGAALGFLVWNFPGGRIFLGDGGAYLLGFWVAELALLLLARNPQVSPLFPLLVCAYPVVETVFSMYRRRWLQQVPPVAADGLHLHSLLYRRVLRRASHRHRARQWARGSSLASLYLALLCAAAVVPAVMFWRHSGLLAAGLAMFVLAYLGLYWRIVRFRAPRWMKRGRAAPGRSSGGGDG